MKKIIPIVLVLTFIAAAGARNAAPAAGKGFTGRDKEFFTDAADGGFLEVKLGEIARQKAESPDVKAFGERMVKDHSAADEELKAVAKNNGAAMPTGPGKKGRRLEEKLSKLKGSQFDKEYMRLMVKEHAKDVTEFSKASEALTNQGLQDWVKKTLPVLEEHLKLAKETATKLGIDAKKEAAEGVKTGEKKM